MLGPRIRYSCSGRHYQKSMSYCYYQTTERHESRVSRDHLRCSLLILLTLCKWYKLMSLNASQADAFALLSTPSRSHSRLRRLDRCVDSSQRLHAPSLSDNIQQTDSSHQQALASLAKLAMQSDTRWFCQMILEKIDAETIDDKILMMARNASLSPGQVSGREASTAVVAIADAASQIISSSRPVLSRLPNFHQESVANATQSKSKYESYLAPPGFQNRSTAEELRRLGYSDQDVTRLKDDVALLLAKEQVTRPRTGPPAKWMGRSFENHRAVAANPTADDASDGHRRKERFDRPSKFRSSSNAFNTTSTPTMDEKLTPAIAGSDYGFQRDLPWTGSNKATSASPKWQTTDAERRAQRDQSAASKPVYNGRRVNNPRERKVKDDPPVGPGIWPDMDTFRLLLRRESSLRLGILGTAWRESVQSEAQWRHDVYREWLWILRNGIGKPIVQSRSDRERNSHARKR